MGKSQKNQTISSNEGKSQKLPTIAHACVSTHNQKKVFPKTNPYARLYGSRSHKNKQLIKNLKEAVAHV
jgi:predicted site-specific integrase-resolvase